MLSLSSPVTFPQSSPPGSKRDRPHDPESSRPKPRARGPFVLDDDEDDEGSADQTESIRNGPLAKKRMLEHPRQQEQLTEPALVRQDKETSSRLSEVLPEEGNDLEHTSGAQSLALGWSSGRHIFSNVVLSNLAPTSYTIATCAGQAVTLKERTSTSAVSYESMVASRSKTKEGRAKRSYYGIDIHHLMDTASTEIANKRLDALPEPVAPIESIQPPVVPGKRSKKTMLWTEKYRARTFTDLCGDDGTNRSVLRWLKRWDSLVFPGAAKARPAVAKRPGQKQQEEEKPHKKILLLTGPPGLGKTTLAHVCAKQAGYEVMEINASDDRSRDVVRNRIRTSLGTESVKTVSNRKEGDAPTKLARPACVIVDEVDGVVSGSGASGEGGFVKALIDLVLLDQKNANPSGASDHESWKKKKGDDFRLMRPLILICNDVYAPALRPLRQSGLAEIIHTGRPTIEAVVGRLKAILDKEGIPSDKDAARKLCEAAWGMTSGIDAKRGAASTVEGDLRGIMVVGEWVAGRFRAATAGTNERLTRQWIERNVLGDIANGAAGARGLGRGNAKDIVSRLFQEGGGFPKQKMDLSESKNMDEQPKTELGFGEQRKKYAMERLQQMTETSGEVSHVLNEVFAEYPNREFNDDCYLSKPNMAYDWLHFHDVCQSRMYSGQEWELTPYLSQPVLACHHLFASPKKHYAPEKRWNDVSDETEVPMPFSGPRADYQAFEAEKQNRAQLQAIQAQLTPSLGRSFRSAEDIASEFMPWLVRIVSPDVKPVVIGGSQGAMASVRKESEKVMVKRAAEVLAEVGVALQRGKIESEVIGGRGPQFVYRMEPDVDALSTYETSLTLLSSQAPTRYAVRQVLDQELQRTILMRAAQAREARFKSGGALDIFPTQNKENIIQIIEEAENVTKVKKDFFGRVIEERPLTDLEKDAGEKTTKEENKVWVTFHEGLNNAVRKPMSLQEFMRGM